MYKTHRQHSVTREFSENRLSAGVDAADGFVRGEQFNDLFVNPWQRQRPRMDDFESIYSRGQIHKHKDEIRFIKDQETRSSFHHSEQSLVLEYSLLEGIHNLGWLGEDGVGACQTSEYDDIKRCCDLVVEFEPDKKGEEPVYLGIDATTDSSSRLESKLVRLLQRIRDGKKNSVEYFINDQGDKIGHLDLPLFIIHLPWSSAPELEDLMINSRKRDLEVAKSARLKVYQAGLIKQIKAQSREFIRFILKNYFDIDPEVKDEEFLNFLQQEKDFGIAKRIGRKNADKLDIFGYYLNVYQKMIELENKIPLPDVEEGGDSLITPAFIRGVCDRLAGVPDGGGTLSRRS